MNRSAEILSRPPLERMLRIHQALQRAEFPTVSKLSLQLEVSGKSIRRDIDFMRDRLSLPIDFDPIRGGWGYTEPVESFPNVQITEGELFALLVAEKALQQYRGTSFERPLVSAIKKLEQSLPQTISLDLSQVEHTISFRTRAEPLIDLGVFDQIANATSTRERLEIEYKKPGQNTADLRLIDPYHLANINGEWFLFAYDHLRKDLRTFVPARIKRIRRTGKRFQKNRTFSLDRRLHGSFGVKSGQEKHSVVVRFEPGVADYIREKKWHVSQELRDLRGGGVELRMMLSSLDEVERWILSWGGNATVVKPRELVGRVCTAARSIGARHRAKKGG
jgi:proteasome accessory factor B